MQLTDAGEKIAKANLVTKRQNYDKLLDGGTDIASLVKGTVCYEVVAYTIFLNGAFTIEAIHSTAGQNWIPLFQFSNGTEWGGGDEAIPKGTAVGFFSIRRGNVFFHAAVATGKGSEVRSVNGGRLGAGWFVPVNLNTVLKVRNPDGTFNYDGDQIRVWKSRVNGNLGGPFFKWLKCTSSPVSSYPDLHWQAPQSFDNLFTSAAAPALAADQNTLWCMHRGSMDQDLWYMNYNSQSGWNPPGAAWRVTLSQSIPQSPAGPALAFDSSNQLWCGYGGAGDNIKTIASTDGFNWDAGSGVSLDTSLAGPAWANFNDGIYLIFSDSALDGRLMTVWFIDGFLSGIADTGNNYTTMSPALATFKNRLWCVYRGKYDGSLYVTTSDGSDWPDGSPIPGITSDCAPALAYIQEQDALLCVFGDSSDSPTFYYTINTSGEPSQWSQPQPINGNPRVPGHGVGLAVYQGNIYCAYLSD